MAKKDKYAHLRVEEGVLKHGLPYRALGTGEEPLVVLRWFTDHHTNPEGWEKSVELSQLAPFGEHFRVYAVNRAPGMAPGTTMADIAAQHAEALTEKFGGPVHVVGPSSGGSLALQLAADHPQVVKKLALSMAGYTMGEAARKAQVAYAEAAVAGKRAFHHTAGISFKNPATAAVLKPLMWLVDPFVRPKEAADMAAFVAAEAGFDVRDRLPGIQVPTLVVSGGKDPACPPEICRVTADEMPDARLITYPEAGHTGTFTDKRFAPDVLEFFGVRARASA
ncbi:alpha/beta fold hydrolase [Streptomyces sp. CA-294286]|uniref:alpha/beta fold hydrolase n=1 Tax=Streptomyces sp. CA-294286 TaxID=3240070 RepID=UPI003D8F36D6